METHDRCTRCALPRSGTVDRLSSCAALFSLQRKSDSITCVLALAVYYDGVSQPAVCVRRVSETARATQKVPALWRAQVAARARARARVCVSVCLCVCMSVFVCVCVCFSLRAALVPVTADFLLTYFAQSGFSRLPVSVFSRLASVADFGCSNVAQLAVPVADALGGVLQLAASQTWPTTTGATTLGGTRTTRTTERGTRCPNVAWLSTVIRTQPRNFSSTMGLPGNRFGPIVFQPCFQDEERGRARAHDLHRHRGISRRQPPRHQPTILSLLLMAATFFSLLLMAATFLSLPRTPYACTRQWSYKFVNRKPRGVHPARFTSWPGTP